MRVLVTGADGFVGQHVLQALLDRGHDVAGGVTRPEPELTTLPRPEARAVEWITFDLTEPGSVRALVAGARPDAILHLAGLTSVSESWREPERTFAVNATGALHLLLAVRALPEPRQRRALLLVGSAEVYGRSATGDGQPIPEDTPLRPLNPYGASKAAQEALGHALGTTDALRLVQTRSFQQTGPGQRPEFVTVDWARQLLEVRRGDRTPVLEVGNLDVSRDFLDVRDAAAAYIALLEGDAEGVFNVCSGRESSLRDLLDRRQDAAGVRVDIRVDPDRLRPADIPALVGDPGKLRTTTGWAPRIPLHQTLADVIRFLAAQDHGR